MPKIKDIIDKFDNRTKEFQKDGYETMTIECVRGVLQSSLTSLLDSLEKELPKAMDYVENTEFIEKNDREIQLYNQRKYSHNNYRQEVINIINSHR